MKRLLLCVALVLIGCGNTKNGGKVITEEMLDKEILSARLFAISTDISDSRNLFISAYDNANVKNTINDQLFFYALNKTSSLIVTYEFVGKDYKEIIDKPESYQELTLDGLCIMNKFIGKYSNVIGVEKLPDGIKFDLNRALNYQESYKKKLSTMSDPLSENKCLSLN